jgi:phosphohistidine phosphatase
MEKHLFLVRHAQADGTNFDIKDIVRPLTTDGEIDASKLGKLLSEKGEIDLVLSSTAIRTQTTSKLIGEQIGYDPNKIEYKEELYEASTRILLKTINELEDNYNTVLMVIHNPGISYLSEYVCGEIINNVVPAGLVHLTMDGEWAEISKGNMELVSYTPPAAHQ